MVSAPCGRRQTEAQRRSEAGCRRRRLRVLRHYPSPAFAHADAVLSHKRRGPMKQPRRPWGEFRIMLLNKSCLFAALGFLALAAAPVAYAADAQTSAPA